MRYLLFLIIIFNLVDFSVAQRPEDSSADERLADQYLREGEFEKAVVLYEELITNNPSPVIYNNYLRCLLELNDFRKAERLVQSRQQQNPGWVRFEVDMGYVYDKAGDSRKMQRHFDALIRNLSPAPMAVNDLANAFLFRNYQDLALKAYLRGRSMLGDASPFNLQIASIYSSNGQYTEMMDEYIALVALDDAYLENVQGLLQDEINNDPTFEKSDALRRVLLQRSQQRTDQTIFVEMLLWLSLQQKDFPQAFRQARVLDRRMSQDGQLVLEVARLSASSNVFDVSRQSYEYVLSLGDLNPYYLDARVGLLSVKYQQATSDYNIDYDLLRNVEKEYGLAIEELGIRAQTVSLMRNLANLKAFYLNDTHGAADLLSSVISLSNVSNRIKGECRIELADILLLEGQLWDAHLLYAQVDKTFRDDPLGHEARFKNARLSFYMGEFKWAKAQLDVLKAATSRLIANDAMALSLLIQDNLEEDGTSPPLQIFARAQMHTFMNNFELALSALDSILTQYPSHQLGDDVLMEKAKIFIRTGQFELADQRLASITSNYPQGLLAADALFERALLYERVFEDIEQAMALYEQILTDYPGSLKTVIARNRFRYLRGDTDRDNLFF